MLVIAWETATTTLSFSINSIEEENNNSDSNSNSDNNNNNNANIINGNDIADAGSNGETTSNNAGNGESIGIRSDIASNITSDTVQTLYSFSSDKSISHSRLLPAVTKAAFKKLKLTPKDLDLIVVGRGPGSFTGLRTGLAFAKGLSLGTGVPIIGVSTLLTLASYPQITPFSLVVPIIDARHKEVFTALYLTNTEEKDNNIIGNNSNNLPQDLTDVLVIKPSDFYQSILSLLSDIRITKDNLPETPIIVLGQDAKLLPIPPSTFIHRIYPPNPSALATIGLKLFKSKDLKNHPPLPLYGRSPEIFKTWKAPTRL